MRKRANPPEKKQADRENSDFAVSRAARRRAKHRIPEESTLLSFAARQELAERERSELPTLSIPERLLEMTFGAFRRGFRWSR